MLATRVSADARRVRVAYEVHPAIPIHDVLVRIRPPAIGLTIRARIRGPITAIVWGFECAEIPLPEPLGSRKIVDDSRRRYPGGSSSGSGARGHALAKLALNRPRTCKRLNRKQVRQVH
jgi:hypothetical protein